MSIIFTNLYLFIMATVLALLEIQIEGPQGWAKNLPTWRPDPNRPIAKLYSKMMSGKELTGYHALLFPFIILIFHLTFFLGTPFSWENEAKILSLYFIFIALEDFLWFVLNPYHPLKNFAKQNINHKSFFLGMPTDYYFAILMSLLVVIPIYLMGNSGIIAWWSENVVLFVVETVAVILFSIYVLDIDNWNKR